MVSNWQELRLYLLSLGPISPSGFGLAPLDRPWRCGWRGLKGGEGWWRGSPRRLFSSLKFNFSPFQHGPWSTDRATASTLRLMKAICKKKIRNEREILGINQNHLFFKWPECSVYWLLTYSLSGWVLIEECMNPLWTPSDLEQSVCPTTWCVAINK